MENRHKNWTFFDEGEPDREMKINYSRTAYIYGCGNLQLARISGSIPSWADSLGQGHNRICISWEDIISYLDDEKSKQQEIYLFIIDVHNQIKGKIGNVIFSL